MDAEDSETVNPPRRWALFGIGVGMIGLGLWCACEGCLLGWQNTVAQAASMWDSVKSGQDGSSTVPPPLPPDHQSLVLVLLIAGGTIFLVGVVLLILGLKRKKIAVAVPNEVTSSQ